MIKRITKSSNIFTKSSNIFTTKRNMLFLSVILHVQSSIFKGHLRVTNHFIHTHDEL